MHKSHEVIALRSGKFIQIDFINYYILTVLSQGVKSANTTMFQFNQVPIIITCQ